MCTLGVARGTDQETMHPNRSVAVHTHQRQLPCALTAAALIGELREGGSHTLSFSALAPANQNAVFSGTISNVLGAGDLEVRGIHPWTTLVAFRRQAKAPLQAGSCCSLRMTSMDANTSSNSSLNRSPIRRSVTDPLRLGKRRTNRPKLKPS